MLSADLLDTNPLSESNCRSCMDKGAAFFGMSLKYVAVPQ